MSTERLRIILETKKTGSGDVQTKKGLDGIAKSAKALGAALGVAALAKGAIELTKLGAAADRQKASLEGLASGVGQSGMDIVKAIQGASDHTISRMDAMAAANKALMMDVAKTPDEFERLTKVASALGRAMGQDATKSIEDFVTASARQSMMIADNLGLTVSATQAAANYAQQEGILGRELTNAEKKQAFLNEMLTQGELKMAQMGDTTLDTAGKIEKAGAAWDDLKVSAGGALAALAETTGAMNWLSETADNITADLSTMGTETYNLRAALVSLGGLFKWNSTMGDEFRLALERQAEAEAYLDGVRRESVIRFEQYSDAIASAEQAQDGAAYAALELARAAETAAAAVGTGERWNQYQAALDSVAEAEDEAARQALKLRDATEQAAQAAQASSEMMFQQSMTMTDQKRRESEQAARHAEEVQALESEHQEALAKIAQRGAAWVEKIDVVAEGKRLEGMRRGLEKALEAREAFTAETDQLTRDLNAKEVAGLEQQIQDKELLLKNHMDGKVTHAGANVDALLAEENRKYQEEMAMLQESRTAQEAEQNRSLGRMVLQHFTSWAQMQNLTAEETLKMQTDIAVKYGLMEESAAGHVANMATNWASELDVMRGDANSFFDAFTKRFNALPSEKVIRIRTELATPTTDKGFGGGETQAMGTNFAMGGLTKVGEFGAELVQLPRGSRVLNAANTRLATRGGSSVVINVTNNIIDPDPEKLVRGIEQYLRLKGQGGFPVSGT